VVYAVIVIDTGAILYLGDSDDEAGERLSRGSVWGSGITEEQALEDAQRQRTDALVIEGGYEVADHLWRKMALCHCDGKNHRRRS